MLRRQCRGSYKPKYKKVGVLPPIWIVKSNVSSVGPSSERNRINGSMLWRRAYARLYYPHRQYTQPFYISICFLLLFFFITIIMVMQTIKVHMTWKFTPSFLWLYFQERLKQWRMAFTALSFVVPFLRYYILYNLRYDVTCCTWYCMKIRHIFGFISLNSLKLCRLGQSTKLNSILVFRYGCQDNRLVSRPLLSKHEFFQIWTFQVFLFCFILSCGIVK